MQPISPVIPELKFAEVVFAKDQPEYRQLPALILNDGLVLTKWKFTFKERLKVLFKGSIYLSLLTFNKPLQPVKLTLDVTDIIGKGCEELN